MMLMAAIGLYSAYKRWQDKCGKSQEVYEINGTFIL
jgi:hypothetical protein